MPCKRCNPAHYTYRRAPGLSDLKQHPWEQFSTPIPVIGYDDIYQQIQRRVRQRDPAVEIDSDLRSGGYTVESFNEQADRRHSEKIAMLVDGLGMWAVFCLGSAILALGLGAALFWAIRGFNPR